MSSTTDDIVSCANCGEHRAGQYCSRCGQNDRNYQRALPPLVWDLLREAFELDSRLIRTGRSLLFKPGELAVEFSQNRRAAYVSPIRLYLFVSLFFFFLLSLTTEFEPRWQGSPELADEVVAVADTDVGKLRQVISESRRTKVEELLAEPDNSIRKQALLQIARGMQQNGEQITSFQLFMIGQIIDVLYDPRNALNQLLDNLPIAVFLMLPIFALLLSLFYLNKHRYYVENLIFATHLHVFAFLIFSLALLIPESTGSEAIDSILDLFGTLLVIVLAAYHLIALRRYYGESRWVTLLKFVGQMMLYFSLLVPTGFVLVAAFTLATV
jgi:hypothetical protein